MKYLISIVGPTAVGKTAYSIHLAKKLDTGIISADSRQVFKFMDIGTAKPTLSEMAGIKHAFISQLEPDEPFNAVIFEKQALERIEEFHQERFTAIMVGGSGLYIKAVWEGFDPLPEAKIEIREELQGIVKEKGLDPLLTELREVDPVTWETIDHGNPSRVIRAVEVFRNTGIPVSELRKGTQVERPFKHIKVALNMDRELLYERINKRVDQMIEKGLVEEVKKLVERYGEDLNAFQTVGYQEIIQYFNGEFGLDEAIRLIKRNSRRFAKRQYTWFRRFPDVAWFEYDQYDEIDQWIFKKLEI